MSALSMRAPAKLNFRLKVKGRRRDGYHELDSIMVPVALFDSLELETGRPGVYLSCRGISVPSDESNLVRQAAESFFEAAGLRPAISIRLTKNIPVSAGLGGGSSDAASTLKALHMMYSPRLSDLELAELALSLGADVPFFLKGRPSLAQGIGEKLEPIEGWPALWYVIITPDIEVSTSWVYEAFSSAPVAGKDGDRDANFGLTHKPCSDIVISFRKGEIGVNELLANDLERVTAVEYPLINTLKKALIRAGAWGALMSGSGPSVFGVFRSREEMLKAERILEPCNYGRIFSVGGLI